MAYDGKQDDSELVTLVGNVGKDPEEGVTKIQGKRILTFSLATDGGDGFDAPPVWTNVAITKPEVIDAVSGKLFKGSKGVVVRGFLREKPGNTQIFRDLMAFAVGTVDWFEAGAEAKDESF